MSNEDARNQLNLVRRTERLSARGGAFGTASIAAVLVLATGVVIDLDMLWLLGLVVLGFIGLSVARPIRLRLDWSDRVGVSLLIVGGLVVVAAYLLTQSLVRSFDSGAPNTLSACAATLAIFVVCLPVLVRLATRRLSPGQQRRLGNG